jgi:hypothetical protein
MMKKFYILLLIVLAARICYGRPRKLTRDTLTTQFLTCYILVFEDKPPIITKYAFFDSKSVKGTATMSEQAQAELRELLKINWVIVIKLVPNTKLLSLNELLEMYKIPFPDRALPVMVDDEIIDYPETIWSSPNQIERIVVEKGKKGSFIHITLSGYEKVKEMKKSGERWH